MRRFTISLFGVVVTFVALAGSNALGQQDPVRFRVLFGELVEVFPDLSVPKPKQKPFPTCRDPDDSSLTATCYELRPASFTADIQAPQKGLRPNVPVNLFLAADPLGFELSNGTLISQATFSLRAPGLSVCSARGPSARIEQLFRFGGISDTNQSNIPEERVFDNLFTGSSPSDIISEGPLAGEPVFACGTVAGEDVAVNCSPDDFQAGSAKGCNSNWSMHGFVHAHGRFGNYIGPTTVRIEHGKAVQVRVTIIIPDGEVLIQGDLAPVDVVYCETAGEPFDQDCIAGEAP